MGGAYGMNGRENRNACRVLMGISEGKRPPGSVDGRTIIN